MEVMKCFGFFEDDRTCSLCNITNNKQYSRCKYIETLKENMREEVKNCEHKKDYILFSECTLYNTKYCDPASTCKKKKLKK